MNKLAVALSTTAALAAGALLGAAVVVYSGAYNVASTRQHMQWVYSLLETTMRHSVQLRARDITVPPLDDPARISRGAACFRDKCVQCHGAPGVSQGDIGKSMQPVPGPLVDALQRWRPREIYWITRHGIKMSGMPAWEFRLDDAQLWDITAFVQRLPQLSPQDYAAITAAPAPFAPASDVSVSSSGLACGLSLTTANDPGASPPPPQSVTPAAPPARGDIERGRQALYQHACNACHTIPGVTGSSPNVGPPLKGLASRSLIAGRLANTPDNLVRWLRDPKAVKPLTAMPDLGVSEAHARDMAAYLGTLH